MSKNHCFRFISLIVIVLTILSLSVVTAQDSLEGQPLFKMLARIPNTTMSRSEIYFNDRKAVELAYPPARVPKNWAEFSAMNDAKGESPDLLPVDIWWRAWRNQSSALTAQYLGYSEDLPSVIGFDYFQIEQEMSYGTPPAQTLQLAGNFNLDAVRAAFTVRGYVRQDNESVEVWCLTDGCDNGMKTNLRDRNPANLFGGNLGRSQPLLIEDSTLISSADETAINNHIDVATKGDESLADLPQYRAATVTITADGSLLQAYFMDGELAQMSLLSPGAILGERATPELIKKMFQDMLKDYETLPVYQLLAIADVATETDQIGEVVLVYANEADANTAAEVLPKRIANYQSVAVNRPFIDLLAERRVKEPVVKVVNTEGSYVVVVAFPTPKATVDDLQKFNMGNSDLPDTTPPGLIYKLLMDSTQRRDLNWLNTTPRSVIEDLAK